LRHTVGYDFDAQVLGPTRLIIAADAAATLSTVLAPGASVGVVHGSFPSALALVSTLRERGHSLVDLGRISPHTPQEEIDTAGDLARRTGVKSIVGVGGGSIIDAAKLIALASVVGDITRYALEFTPPQQLVLNPLPAELVASLPAVLAVPTTAGSASEISPGAGMRVEQTKLLFSQPALIPSVAVYCPALVAQAPPQIWYPSWLSAVARGIEALYCKRRSWLSDAWAFEGLRLLGAAPRDPQPAERLNPDQARELLAGSLLTGRALGLAGGGVVHAIGHAVGGLTGLPHGIVHAASLRGAVEGAMRTIPALQDTFAHALTQLSGKPCATPALILDELQRLRWKAVEPDWGKICAASSVVEVALGEPLVMTHPYPVTRALVESIIGNFWS